MSINHLLLDALHGSFSGYESLHQALRGVTEQEALWQIPSFANTVQVNPWPQEGTVHFQVAHISNCKRNYIVCIQEKRTDISWLDRERSNTFQEDVNELKKYHEEMCDAVKLLNDDDCNAIVFKSTTLFQYIHERIRHDIWHCGQIAAYRRLYKDMVLSKK
ncbi:MAG: DinB family protein [Planctomycetota bacterium]